MRIPVATYRLQFTPEFGFDQASDLLDYLKRLGISDLYASPIFRARSGSYHGYDVVDPTCLNPQLGNGEQFARLVAKIRALELGWLQDIVPNHMAVSAENPFLADVLQNGTGSPFYRFFDIDWEHSDAALKGRLLAPFLGRFFGEALEAGELRLQFGERGFAVHYFEQQFPLSIDSYLPLLSGLVEPLRLRLGEEHPDYIQLLGVLYVVKTLGSGSGTTTTDGRPAQVKFIQQTLARLFRKSSGIRNAMAQILEFFNGTVGVPDSFSPLEGLLGEQRFRLAFWKVAAEEINYRRFFNINDLISLRIEDAEVFKKTHALMLNLVTQGPFTGLRIDHIDGLYDPLTYLRRLRERLPTTYLLVEKILGPEERLPDWPVQGTTGYDFLNRLTGIFCHQPGVDELSRFYTNRCGGAHDITEELDAAKRLIIQRHMTGDVNNLTRMLKAIAGHHRYGSDITFTSLQQALIELMVRFTVYRSYLGPSEPQTGDRSIISECLKLARQANSGLLIELDFLERILLQKSEENLSEEEMALWLQFAMRLQQFTGPLMAKGLEDTLFYRYNRLIALNEVGGHPGQPGMGLDQFHQFCCNRMEKHPNSLNATATHDTKRGEDLRLRLCVLSEIPQEWSRQVSRWFRQNRSLKSTVQRRPVPDRNDEYFLYQTLIGALPFTTAQFPAFMPRLEQYLIKAVREAKVHTAWLKPDSAYEDGFIRFARKLFRPDENNPFLQEFIPFQKRIAFFGMFNSLAQTLIKITAPGVPDFYQGCELWDLNLVDPDNRRPVDFTLRNDYLRELQQPYGRAKPLLQNLRDGWQDGRIKLYLIMQALDLRRQRPFLFQTGIYQPLNAMGKRAQHVMAFSRCHEGDYAITIVPRFLTCLLEPEQWPLGRDFWGDTTVIAPNKEPKLWFNVLTGERIELGDAMPLGKVLGQLPVALLTTTPKK